MADSQHERDKQGSASGDPEGASQKDADLQKVVEAAETDAPPSSSASAPGKKTAGKPAKKPVAKSAKGAKKPGKKRKPSAPPSGSTGAATQRRSRSAIMRRPPEAGLPLLRHRTRDVWSRLLEVHWLWLAIFVLAATWSLLPQRVFFLPDLEEGEIAPRTFIAERDVTVVNEEETAALRDRAQAEQRPVYDLDRGLENELRSRLGVLFERGRELVDRQGPRPGLEQLQAELTEASRIRIGLDPLAFLVDRAFSPQLEDRLGGVLTRLMRQGVVQDKGRLLEHSSRGILVNELPSGQRTEQRDLYRYLGYPQQVREVVEEDLSGWDDLRSRERSLLADLLLAVVEPNLTYNSSATLEARQEAGREVGSVTYTFNQGEVIVRRWARIDALRARALQELAGSRDLQAMAFSVFGVLLLVSAVALMLWLAVGQEQRADRSRRRFFSEVVFLLTLSLVGARFAFFVAGALAAAIEREPFTSAASYGLAVPFAAVALVTVLLYGRNVALVLSLVFSLLVGHLGGTEAAWTITVYSLASCLAAVFALDHAGFRQRSALTRAAWVIAATDMVAILSLRLVPGTFDGGWAQLGFDLLCGAAGGFLAATVTSFAVPIFESLFQVTTSIKLVELANPNLPLLRRLAFEAPGTFQHSLAVANLSKAGVEAVDGDPVLVHTGALYHDIGKIFRPRYFVENQPPGQNPHDKIQPSMSALILINHVKEGLELAVKEGLPQPIIDAIEQHHGTRLIKFFYARAQERADPETEEVREEEFRYPGPKPQTKEMGVLMLADAVEAASRTLVDPSRQKLRAVLRAIFDDCLKDGQLDQTDLTLGDLRKVEDAFLRVLTNVYHRRVDYPGFDFNRPDRYNDASGPASGGPDASRGATPAEPVTARGADA